MHFNQLCYLKKSASGDLKLALDELPKDLQCFRFQFLTEREILGGTIDKRDPNSDADDFDTLISKRESHWSVVTNFRLHYRLCTKLFRMVCDRFSRKKFERNGR